MASFVPDLREGEAPNFMGYSRGTGPNRAFSALFEGVGSTVGAAAGFLDEKNKTDIYNEVDKKVSDIRASYGVDSESQVAGATPVPGPDGTAPGPIPADLKGSSDYLSRLQKGYMSGTIKEVHYYGQLNNVVKDMRLKYPNYNQYIDATIQNITGVTPANAVVSQLRQDALAEANAAKAESAKQETYINQNQAEVVTAFPDYFQNPSKYSFDQIRNGVANIKAQDANISRMVQQVNYESSLNTLSKEKAVASFGKIAAVVSNQAANGGLNAMAGGTWNEIQAKVQKWQTSGVAPNPEETQQILAQANAMKSSITQKMNEIALQDGFSSTLDKKSRDEAIALATGPIDNLIDALVNKDVGLVNLNAAWIKANQDETTANAIKQIPALALINSLKTTGGDAAVGSYLQTAGPGIFNEISFLAAKAPIIQTSIDPTKSINDDLKANSNLMKDPSLGVSPRANNESLNNHVSAILDVKNEGLGEKAALRLFNTDGGLNLSLVDNNSAKGITGRGTPQDRVFAKLTSPEVTARMVELGKKNPDLWTGYVTWATNNFSARVRSTALDMKQQLDNIPELAAFIRPSYDANTGKLIAQEIPYDKGPSNINGVPIDYLVADQAKQMYMNSLRDLNVAISGMKPILDANGGNSAAQMETLLKVLGIPVVGEESGSPDDRQERNDLGISLDPLSGNAKSDAINSAADRLGIAPIDLATAISYETNGSFRTDIYGGRGGNYLGLIQFGPEEQSKYGVTPDQSFEDQLDSAVRFLQDRGFKKGMSLMDLYSTINAGTPGRYDASDRPGSTVRSHVNTMLNSRYRTRAEELLASNEEGEQRLPFRIR